MDNVFLVIYYWDEDDRSKFSIEQAFNLSESAQAYIKNHNAELRPYYDIISFWVL